MLMFDLIDVGYFIAGILLGLIVSEIIRSVDDE